MISVSQAAGKRPHSQQVHRAALLTHSFPTTLALRLECGALTCGLVQMQTPGPDARASQSDGGGGGESVFIPSPQVTLLQVAQDRSPQFPGASCSGRW